MNTLNIDLSNTEYQSLLPKILIFGVGGAGGNAINNMIRSNLHGVEFIAANTDAQALSLSESKNKVQLGLETTKGLGAGSYPEVGKTAAEEAFETIDNFLESTNMIFITAGMGGGTGTGAAPVIAKMARERDILTAAVVTKPFEFEGKYRMEIAERGIEELKKYVDTLIIVPNQNLFRVANVNTTVETAFQTADDVLHAGVRGITDLITMPGLINLDFADVKTVMKKMGKAMMGTGEAIGENRAIKAVEEAISNPLLDDVSIRGAKGAIVNITGSPDITLFEFDEAAKRIKEEIDPDANIIIGTAFNKDIEGIRVSVFATGIENEYYNVDKEEEKVSPKDFEKIIMENVVDDEIESVFVDGEDDNSEVKPETVVVKTKLSSSKSADTGEFFDPGESVKISDFEEEQKPNYYERNQELQRLKQKQQEEEMKKEKKRGFFGLFKGKKKGQVLEDNKKGLRIVTEDDEDLLVDKDTMDIPAYLRKKGEV